MANACPFWENKWAEERQLSSSVGHRERSQHLAESVKKFVLRDCVPYAEFSPFESNPDAFISLVRFG